MIARFVLRLGVWAMGLLSIFEYVRIGLKRMAYPLELDCIEGVMMDHVVRLAHGQAMYVKPTLHFISLAYMPIFAFVSSWLARAFGPALWEPRLVAFGSSLGIALLAAVVVWIETRRPTLAVGAAGVYCMAFGLTGSCYDVARPDSLMLLLAFSGLAILRYTRGLPGAVAAAFVLALAFFTKQHAVLFCFGAVAYLLFQDRRRFVPFTLTLLVLCLGGYLALTVWLGEWFRFYTWSIPRGWSQIDRARIEHYVGHGLFGALGALTIPAVLALGTAERPWKHPRGLWFWAGLAGVGTGLLATLDAYAYRHVLIPTVVAFTFLGPIALDQLGRQLEAGAEGGRGLGTAVIYGVLLAQFFPLLYPIHDQLPHPRAREAFAAFESRVASIAGKGDLLMPYHGWYTERATGHTSLQIIPFDDISRSKGNTLLARDPHYLDRMLDSLRSGPGRPHLILDRTLEEMGEPWASLAGSYRVADTLGWVSEPLRPVSGNRFTPTYILEPVEPAAAVPALRVVTPRLQP